jgi:hypothetical protein
MIATLLMSHLSVPCSREATGPHDVETTVVAPEPVSRGIADRQGNLGIERGAAEWERLSGRTALSRASSS